MQDILEREPRRDLKVFVIWEPVLISDLGRPAGSALRRISDSRAAQFWDKDHLFAKKLAADLAVRSQPTPQCCTANGVLWDVVLVYGEGAEWDVWLPAPLLIEGPVVDTPRRIAGLLGGH